MGSTDLLEARRKALEARLVEAGGKMPLRPLTDPLAACVKAVQDRLAGDR